MNEGNRVSDCLHSRNSLNLIKEIDDLLSDRIRGIIAGNIIGDMLGLPFEGLDFGNVKSPIILKDPPDTIISNHISKYKCKVYSDDTSMFLALFHSLYEKGRVDKINELTHYKKWLIDGEYTPDKKAFGFGKTTYKAVLTGVPGTSRDENGNGALMRSSIITPFYINKSDKSLEEASGESASVTHAHPIAIFCNIIYNLLLKYLILGHEMHGSLSKCYDKYYNIIPDINDIFFEPIYYGKSGYVVSTLQTAIWLNVESRSFSEVIAKAISVGGDSDTILAVSGAIGGAIYGFDSFSEEEKSLALYTIKSYSKLEKFFNQPHF
ncbi:MAG: ADP-ribosylglycohydrolase family protein [Calditerrivibrio sp.]|nr:ADP-ribosylglycohydrolase family protein [Calditerrivibrio sp.]